MIKLFFRLIILSVLALILLFIFAPNIISTQWGQTIFFKVYKAATGKTLSAESLKISWWKGQDFADVTLENPREKMIFKSPKITTDATLWQLVFFNDLGNMEIASPKLVINADLPQPIKNKIAKLHAGFIPSITISDIPLPPLPRYLGHITVKDGEAQFLSSGFETIELKSVALDISLLKSQTKIKGNGQTFQGDIKGNFDVSLMYNPSQAMIELTANMQNFPLQSIDQTIALFHPSLEGALLDAIGPAVNVQLKLKNLPQILELYCDASSPSFSAHIETKMEDDEVTLASPGLIQFQIPSALVHKIVPVSLEAPFKGELKIENFSLPLDDRESFSFQATLKGETPEPFALFLSTDDFKNRNFTLKIDSPQIKLSTALYLPDQWQQLTLKGEGILPSNTVVHFSAQTVSVITANVQGDKWQGTLWGGYDPKNRIAFLNKPAQIVYQLDQLPAPMPPLLQQPLPIHVQIEPFRLSLPTLSGSITAQIKTDPVTLEGALLGATTLTATGDLKSRKGTFKLASTLDKGTILASGTFAYPQNLAAKAAIFTNSSQDSSERGKARSKRSGPNDEPIAEGAMGEEEDRSGKAAADRTPDEFVKVAAKATFTEVPLSFADLFFNELTPIVGSTLSGTLDLTYSPQRQQVSFDVSTSALSAQGTVEQTSDSLELTKPLKAVFTLSPEGYTALDDWLPTHTPFTLLQPAQIKATIASLNIPLKNWAGTTGKADLSIDTLSFKDMELNKISLNIDHLSPTSPTNFNLTATGVPEGSVAVQGKVDFASGFTELNCRLDQFPTDILDAVSRSSVSMATIFGPQVNLSASSSLEQWSGPLKLQLNSSNIRASVNGTLSSGVLTLNDTLHCQVTLTKDLGKLLLDTLNPLSLSSITSEAPITLEIPAAGFSYPIYPLNDAEINIASGRLELGKLHCKNEGNVNVALSLLKQSQRSQNETMELWFAPLDFHIKKGVLDCERTEILIANNFQICTWGTVDFVKKYVDMILGLTASCLKKAFGVKDLPENYVLQVPMKGPFDNVKINTPKATSKIAALLLWSQKAVSDALGGAGPGGAVVGKFLNKLSPLPDMGSKAPPPKRPFPWEKNGEAVKKKKKTSAASLNKKKKLIDPQEQPLKQVLKFLK